MKMYFLLKMGCRKFCHLALCRSPFQACSSTMATSSGGTGRSVVLGLVPPPTSKFCNFHRKKGTNPGRKKQLYTYIFVVKTQVFFSRFDFNIYKNNTYLLIFVTIPSMNQGTHLVLRVLWVPSSSPLVKGS